MISPILLQDGHGHGHGQDHHHHGQDVVVNQMVNNMILQFSDKTDNPIDKELGSRIIEKSPLGLTLHKTPSLMNLIETTLMQESSSSSSQESDQGGGGSAVVARRRRMDDSSMSQGDREKLKASNFPASYLKIGSWEVVSKNEGDLVAKCYFAKRKLVWEVLEPKQKLKRKIEIQWTDILGMRATMRENQPGILEIELKQPPTFFNERDPQPRKHTIWNPTEDFTELEASTCRRHLLKFPPGALDRHYDKILQADGKLLKLSHQPFPTLAYPFFLNHYDMGFSLDYNPGCHSEIPAPALSYYLPTTTGALVPTQSLQAYQQAATNSDYMPNDESINNYRVDHQNQRMGYWNQGGINGFANVRMTDQFHGLPPIVTTTIQVNQVFSSQDYQSQTYNEAIGQLPPIPTNLTLSNLEDQQLGDTQMGYPDQQMGYMNRLELQNLINQAEGANLASSSSSNGGFRPMEFGMGGTDHSNGMMYPQPQPISSMPPQDPNDHQLMNMSRNNLLFQSYSQDSRTQDFANDSTVNGKNGWT